ncbi:MAG: glycosyltransferase family 2 protein, partial [Candidatus Dormibacteraeota bacterium]|nr:glycosyltransferase family 2 protein [Candidatus Dormibacteraeota bacterium]
FDDAQVGMATSRICHFTQRPLINACGNGVHLSGFGYCRGYNQPRERFDDAFDVAAVSGCAFMFRRDILIRTGGFDEAFFLYVEDTDLSMRVRLMGYRIRYVPDSVVYHKYSFRLTPRKFFLLERNRSQLLVKAYRWSTLVELVPTLLATSTLMWIYAAARGPSFLRAKLDADLWLVRNWRSLMARRRQVQASRAVSDAELLQMCDVSLPLDQIVGEHRPKVLDLATEVVYRTASAPVRFLNRALPSQQTDMRGASAPSTQAGARPA